MRAGWGKALVQLKPVPTRPRSAIASASATSPSRGRDRTARAIPDAVAKQPSVIARIVCDAGCVVSLFRLPLNEGMERREAPGSLRGSPHRLARPVCRAKIPGPKSLRGVGVPGRAGSCEEPCASRRSIAARVVGGRTLLRHQGIAIDDALD
jgi:hypothetical protein